jgi:hypothetical protein
MLNGRRTINNRCNKFHPVASPHDRLTSFIGSVVFHRFKLDKFVVVARRANRAMPDWAAFTGSVG